MHVCMHAIGYRASCWQLLPRHDVTPLMLPQPLPYHKDNNNEKDDKEEEKDDKEDNEKEKDDKDKDDKDDEDKDDKVSRWRNMTR